MLTPRFLASQHFARDAGSLVGKDQLAQLVVRCALIRLTWCSLQRFALHPVDRALSNMGTRVRITAGTIALVFSGILVVSPTPALAQSCVPVPTKVREGKTERIKVVRQASSDCAARAKRSYFITRADCKCCGDCELEDFARLGVELSRFIFGISGTLALAMFVLGGFWWLAAAGRTEWIEKGKKTLGAAVIGLALIFGAWIIVNTVLAFLTGKTNNKGVAQVFSGRWVDLPK